MRGSWGGLGCLEPRGGVICIGGQARWGLTWGCRGAWLVGVYLHLIRIIVLGVQSGRPYSGEMPDLESPGSGTEQGCPEHYWVPYRHQGCQGGFCGSAAQPWTTCCHKCCKSTANGIYKQKYKPIQVSNAAEKTTSCLRTSRKKSDSILYKGSIGIAILMFWGFLSKQ